MVRLPVAGVCPTVSGAAVSGLQNPRVTQGDREAAAAFWVAYCGDNILAWPSLSSAAQRETIEAFARHREAAEAASKAREAALVEALTVAANRLDLWHVSAIASGNEALRCKLANWCEEARAALTKEPDA